MVLFSQTLEIDFKKKIDKLTTSNNDKLFNLKQQMAAYRKELSKFSERNTSCPDPNADVNSKVEKF